MINKKECAKIMETSNENKSADSIPTKKDSPPVAPLVVGKIDMSPIKLKT